jgi:hypothetical protein
MRFQFGEVPPNPHFDPSRGGWRKIREPGLGWYYVFGLPLAAFTVGCLLVAIDGAGDTSPQIVVRPGDLSLGRVVVGALVVAGGFVALILVHEGIHLLAHPDNGRTPNSVVGVWLSRGVIYAHYDGEISRNRFVLMVALPFLLLSVLPVALFWAVGRVYLWLAAVALVNGIASCFDLLVIGICLSQVPGRAVLRNHGWDTYWRPVDDEHAAPDLPAGPRRR